MLGLAGAALAWTGYRSAVDEERDRIAMGVVATRGDVGQFVRGRMQLLEALGSSQAFSGVRAGDAQERLDRLDAERMQLTAGVIWADAAGVVRGATGSPLATGRPLPGELGRAAARVRDGGGAAVTPVVSGGPLPAPLVAVVSPTVDARGRITGTLVGGMDVAWLNTVAAGRRDVRGGETVLVDRRGVLFVAPGLTGPRDVSGDPLLAAIRARAAAGEDSGTLTGVTGVSGARDVLVGWTEDPSVTGWTMMIERPMSEVRGPAREDLIAQLLLLGALMAAGVSGAIWVGRRLDRERATSETVEERIHRLQEMTAALAVAATSDDVAAAVLELGRGATGAAAGSIGLVSRDGRNIETLALVGYSDAIAARFPVYPLDADLPMPECLRTGPVWLRSAAEVRRRYPHLTEFHASMTHEAVASLPLRVDGRDLGGLALSFADVRAFDEDERGFLLAVADLCAQALDRARLYEEEHRETERQQFLAKASVVLSTPQDPLDTMSALTRLAVPGLADWCSVSVPAGDHLEVVAIAHTDPDRQALAEELVQALPPTPLDAPDGAALVMRTGTPEVIPEVTREYIEARVPPGRMRDLAMSLELSSGVIVPLVARGRVLGVLTLATSGSARRLDEDDLRFAADLGARAGLALDNAQLLERTRGIAEVLQQSLLPERLPDIPGLQVAARYQAGGEGVDVGGDFYDLVPLGGDAGWAAVLGDVCGKGPQAAALTALARHTLRAESDLLVPSVVLHRLNDAVLRYKDDMRFLTAVYAWLRDEGDVLRVTVSCGGHPPPLVLRAGGGVEVLVAPGSLIGVLPDASFADADTVLGPGDALVLYSDGITEARDADGGLFDTSGVADALRESAGQGAETVASAVMREVRRFQGPGARDDIALLVVRVDPAGAEMASSPVAARGAEG